MQFATNCINDCRDYRRLRDVQGPFNPRNPVHCWIAFVRFAVHRATNHHLVGGYKRGKDADKVRFQFACWSYIHPRSKAWKQGDRNWAVTDDSLRYKPPAMVRAIQGHSLDGICDARLGTHMTYEMALDMPYAVHGTTEHAWASIARDGLIAPQRGSRGSTDWETYRTRNCIHMSPFIAHDGRCKSGMRHDKSGKINHFFVVDIASFIACGGYVWISDAGAIMTRDRIEGGMS